MGSKQLLQVKLPPNASPLVINSLYRKPFKVMVMPQTLLMAEHAAQFQMTLPHGILTCQTALLLAQRVRLVQTNHIVLLQQQSPIDSSEHFSSQLMLKSARAKLTN